MLNNNDISLHRYLTIEDRQVFSDNNSKATERQSVRDETMQMTDYTRYCSAYTGV